MEHNHFKALSPTADTKKIASGVRACIKVMQKHRISLAKIANLVSDASSGKYDLNENTLKSFMQRGDRDAHRSETLEALYNYLREQYYKFEAPIRAEMAGHFDDLAPGYDLNGETRKTFERAMEHVFGGLLLNWVGTTPEAIKKYQIGLSSDYYMFRKSVRSSKHIVRSEVKIEQIAIKDLSVTHLHYDRNEDMRVSSGFMVPAEFNHFAVMNVENGASIEFIALKKPITEIFKRLIGFIITINSNGVLVCARTVLIKKEYLSFEPPIRFLEEKYSSDEELVRTLRYLDDDQAMTIPDRTKELYEDLGEA